MKTDPWNLIVQRLLDGAKTLDDRRDVTKALRAVFPENHPSYADVVSLEEALSIALLAQRELCLGISQTIEADPDGRGGRRLSDRIAVRGSKRLDNRQQR